LPVEEARRQRRDKIVKARRTRWLRAFIAVIVIGCLGAAAYIIYNSRLFSVRRIEVTGNQELTKTRVIELSGIGLGDNIFQVDLDAAKRRLTKNPWLDGATLSRQIPAIIRIRVRERAAAVALYRPEATYVLDKTGFVLEKEKPLAETGLPTIRDAEVKNVKVGTRLREPVLLDALKALLSLSENIRASVDTISAPEADKLVFFTNEGLEIDYGGAQDMEAKNEVINRVLKEESGKVVTIDVRVVTNPTSKPRVQKLGGAPAD
jgi:cell division protein FtsQ